MSFLEATVCLKREKGVVLGHAGQLFVGSKLAQGATVSLNPLLAAGWAGLLANALNCIPVGALMAPARKMHEWLVLVTCRLHCRVHTHVPLCAACS